MHARSYYHRHDGTRRHRLCEVALREALAATDMGKLELETKALTLVSAEPRQHARIPTPPGGIFGVCFKKNSQSSFHRTKTFRGTKR